MIVIFDVDGTLTRTSALDAAAYARAFADIFGAPLPSTDWSTYADPTDSGVAAEAAARLGLDPARLPEFRGRLVREIRATLAGSGARPTPGAKHILQRTRAAGHRVAVATGALAACARLKLAAARVRSRAIPLAGSDEVIARAEILHRARSLAGGGGPAVYVADGSWDVAAADEAGMGFVGIDADRDGRLRALGVREVLDGFEDLPRVLAALERAGALACRR